MTDGPVETIVHQVHRLAADVTPLMRLAGDQSRCVEYLKAPIPPTLEPATRQPSVLHVDCLVRRSPQ
jgi:hypothetical protein